MKSVAPAIMFFAIAMTSLGFVCGQQSEFARPALTPRIKPRSLIRIDAGSELPFVIDSAAAEELVRANNEAAAKHLEQIKRKITDLVIRYPESPASKEISEILDKSGLKVIEGYGVYSKDTFVSTIPITR
jgi:hypothetical protein